METPLAALDSVADILARAPLTRAAHLAELACGWTGSDGCTCALDTLFGSVQGIPGLGFHPEAPCNAHDKRYRTIRRELAWGTIDHLTALQAKGAADQMFLEEMLAAIEAQCWAVAKPIARWRARRRFEAVHTFGFTSVFPLDDREVFLRPAKVA